MTIKLKEYIVPVELMEKIKDILWQHHSDGNFPNKDVVDLDNELDILISKQDNA